MTTQAAFNVVWAYFVEDRHGPLFGQYVDAKTGMRCAVGCLLSPDTVAQFAALGTPDLGIQTRTIDGLLDPHAVVRSKEREALHRLRADLGSLSPEFLHALQTLNDQMAKGAEEDRAINNPEWLSLFHFRMEYQLRELAARYELVIPDMATAPETKQETGAGLLNLIS